MAIHGFDRRGFEHQLQQALSPAQPIATPEHLHGREKEREDLRKALAMPGRHAFIYGDRGVGKSSLAATIAYELQHASQEPIIVGGSSDETFSSILRSIVSKVYKFSPAYKKQNSRERSMNAASYVGGKNTASSTEKDLANTVYTVAEAADILRAIPVDYSESPVILLDEFDRIKDKSERSKFAELLKHMGDSRIPVKFIFTGVGKSLEDLIGTHGSAIRQLHTLELARLSWDGRWEIAIEAAKSFGLELPRDIYVRIAGISDGYPYYVHLMMEKILWQAFEDDKEVGAIAWGHFRLGLRDAIDSVNAELKRPYEKALRERTKDFEPVLWATADGEALFNLPTSYFGSYTRIMKDVGFSPVLDATKFRRRLQKLMSDGLGPILRRDHIHSDYYIYCENMLRGYVRMQAEANGVDLRGEEAPVPAQKIHAPARVSVGYQGSHPPTGWRRG